MIRKGAARLIAGESLRSVTAWLTETEVPTVNGAPWRTQTVRLTLTNPRLIGQRTHRGQVVAQAVWEPILTETAQQQVIARLEQRRVSGRRAPRRYALSGLLRCGKCGHKLYSSPRGDRRRYVCLSGPDHEGCGRLTVVAQPLEEAVAELVLFRLDTPELAAGLAHGDDSPQAEELRAQLDADRALLEELSAMFAHREISAREWKLARDPIAGRINLANSQLAALANAHSLADLVGTGSDLRARWSTLNLDRQAAILRAVLDHVVIGPGVNGARTLDPDRITPVWQF